MRTRARLAAIGIGIAAIVGGLVGPATASSPPPSTVAPAGYDIWCTRTIKGPTYVYASGSFNSRIVRGKHTGDIVKAIAPAGRQYVGSGFVEVVLSNGEQLGYVWAGNVIKPRPYPTTHSRYTVTGGTVNVRTAPSTSPGRSTILGQKSAGNVVTGSALKGESWNGFVPVIRANHDIAWISKAYLR